MGSEIPLNIKESDIISQDVRFALKRLTYLFGVSASNVGSFVLTRPAPNPRLLPGDITFDIPRLAKYKNDKCSSITVNCRNCGYNSHESICPACGT